MEKIYILNIFLIFTIILFISLFLVYYFKISRLATNLTKNLEYGCNTELAISEPEYKNTFTIEEKDIFYHQFLLYGMDILYYYSEKNKKLETNDNTTILYEILRDKDKNMFGMFAHHKKANVNFIIFRGSQTSTDWSDIDFDINQTDYTFYNNACVHAGFYKRFNELKEQLVKILSSYDKNIPLYIGGHSLGCPICVFTHLLIIQKYNHIQTNSYVFALPKMGNQNFAQYVNINLNNKLKVYENKADIIPQLPFTSTLNVDDKTRPFIYYNFSNNFYYYFYCAQKFICSNHGLKVYYDNFNNSQRMTNLNYCNNKICNYIN